MFNFESLEQLRYETTEKVMRAMAEIAASTDTSVKLEDRINAARVVDAMSDSLLKVMSLDKMAEKFGKDTDKIVKQIKGLTDGEEH